MRGQEFKLARKQRGWTQTETADRLGVTQPFLALLENGKRKLGSRLKQKAARVLDLPATVLPLREKLPRKVDPQRLAQQFASLGYPGFAYLRGGRKRNPAEVLLTALAQDDLESRLTEALPWLLLNYPDMNKEWLVGQARLRNLSNRLGFVVSLAKGVTANSGETTSVRYQTLDRLEGQLRESRLDKEDTLCQSSLSEREKEWLKQMRPQEAAYWHLLTTWQPAHLQYGL